MTYSFTDIFKYYYRNNLFIDGKLIQVPAWTVNKVAVDDFCEKYHIPRAKILKKWDHPSEIDFKDLPHTFVIKPANLNSARGVQVLEREDALRYFDFFSGEMVTLEDVIEKQQQELDKVLKKEKHRLKNFKILAQERIVDKGGNLSVPTDFKFWVIGGKVCFIAQMNERNADKVGVCFYNADFDPLSSRNDVVKIREANAEYVPHADLDAEDRADLVSLAERAAAQMNAHFIRVDLYLANDGPKLGELTPVPGTVLNGKFFQFTEQFDRYLGNVWAQTLGIKDFSWQT